MDAATPPLRPPLPPFAPPELDLPRWDQAAAFPASLVAWLHGAGLLAAPCPRDLGGEGLGTDPATANRAHAVLRALGQAWLPLGRVYEGHLNALRLIVRYGGPEPLHRAAADARAGHLFAIWAAENPADPVRLAGGTLSGSKTFASAAGTASRAVVTVQTGAGEQLAFVAVPPEPGRIGAGAALLGMQGAGTAPIDLTGIAVPPAAMIGAPGDYMRQPEISLGAWRPLAVLSGAVSALAGALRLELAQRGRTGPVQQQARFAALLVAAETARLWSERAAWLAETQSGEDAAAYVKLARAAVDDCCAEAIRLAQRSAGLAAFVRPHPIERLCRDLATYMRQPALDEVIGEAAVHCLGAGPPP